MAHPADYHVFWKSAVNRLEQLHNRVKEGRDLDSAVEFARFLLNSGIWPILQEHDNNGFLKVDSAFLRWKAEELQRAVCEIYAKGQNLSPKQNSSLEEINHKLDLIAGRLARVPIVETAGSEMSCGPNLSVISGGASDDSGEGVKKNGAL